MNDIRNDLPNNIKVFFTNLKNYLETDLFFYGSVTRGDYIPGKSDIDLAIFTDNVESILSKLQHFLKIKRNEIDTVLWKLNGKMIYGYKVKIDDINAEIAVYNDEYKDILVDEFNRPITNKTLLTTVLLLLLKLFYYQIPLLPKKMYIESKRYVLNEMMGKKESVFFLMDNKKK